MSPERRLLIAVGGLAAITVVGTLGYYWSSDLGWIDALYMTVITMSTVGFREVVPLQTAGKLFTIGLILSSVGLVLYSLSVLAEGLIEGRLTDVLRGTSMEHKIQHLRDHVIVCGFGRFGRVVADELSQHDVPLVIVETDPERSPEIERRGWPHVVGSAVSDEVLGRAGVECARAIVVAIPSEADNVFVALSARERNPEIRIHVRGETEATVRRLKLAGADQVVSAYQIGGQRMAASILRPAVVDFLEIARPRYGATVDLEEVRVDGASPLVAQTIGNVEQKNPRVRVIALKRGDERIRLIPAADMEIAGGDHLVVIGDSDSLENLATRAISA